MQLPDSTNLDHTSGLLHMFCNTCTPLRLTFSCIEREGISVGGLQAITIRRNGAR